MANKYTFSPIARTARLAYYNPKELLPPTERRPETEGKAHKKGIHMSNLERATHFTLIAVALMSAGLLLERRFAQRPASPTIPSLVGTRLDVPGADWGASPVNAVLVMSTECAYCRASMPFYRRLVEAKRIAGSHVPFSVLSREPQGPVRQMLLGENINTDGIYQLINVDSGLRATPTLLIVDATGIVRKSFVGKLRPAQEEEYLKIVRAGIV